MKADGSLSTNEIIISLRCKMVVEFDFFLPQQLKLKKKNLFLPVDFIERDLSL